MSSDDETNSIDYIQSNDYYILDETDNTIFIKIDGRTLIQKVCQWSYNRPIINNVVNELYNSITPDNNIIWTLTAIKERDNENLYLIDGQHRFEAIKRKLSEDVNMILNKHYYIMIYLINNQKQDSNYIVDLFKKINNNTPLISTDYPQKTIINIIENAILIDPILKKGIRVNEKTLTAHQPYIHKNTLNDVLSKNKAFIEDMEIEEFINNLKIINNNLSLKSFEEVYHISSDINKYHWKKANDIKFFIGLKNCHMKYRIDNLLKNIKTPNVLF
jgi:hypothetical protein